MHAQGEQCYYFQNLETFIHIDSAYTRDIRVSKNKTIVPATLLGL